MLSFSQKEEPCERTNFWSWEERTTLKLYARFFKNHLHNINKVCHWNGVCNHSQPLSRITCFLQYIFINKDFFHSLLWYNLLPSLKYFPVAPFAVTGHFISAVTMSLACLVCHGMNSPSNSFRSYSVSSSEGENLCGAVVACLSRKVMPSGAANGVGTSKVTPFPLMATGQGTEGAPRLQRSHAVSRDLVRNWNFDEIVFGN